jgi:hypothetical protein
VALTEMIGKVNDPKHERPFRLVVIVQLIESAPGFLSTARDAEHIWHQEQVVVPLERVGALDLDGMVKRAINNVVVIAGQDNR